MNTIARRLNGATIGGLLVDILRRNRDRAAFVHEKRIVSYQEVAEKISRAIQLLDSLNLKPDAVIAQLAANSPDVFFLMSAAFIRGFRSLTLRATSSLSDQAYILRHSGAVVLFVDEDRCEQVADLKGLVDHELLTFSHHPNRIGVPHFWKLADAFDPAPLQDCTSPQDIVRLAYTGGTTGRPKGVMLSSCAQVTNAMLFLAGLRWPKEVRFLCSAPISHAAGAMIVPALWHGGTFYLQDSFNPDDFLDAIERHRITATFLVPTMIYKLLDHPRTRRADLKCLEMVVYGASTISPSRLQEAIDVFGPVLVQTYGQTEGMSAILALAAHEHTPERLSFTGRPYPGLSVKLLDEEGKPVPAHTVGEICVCGPTVMSGYLNDPEQTGEVLRDGWLHTGDMGVEDEEGFIAVVDRKKDMIITGGFNVYPREIEDVLHKHPDVSAAAVIGIPDPLWGEAVKALVVRRPTSSVEKEELLAFVRKAKGPVSTPKMLEFVEQLPMTPLGKYDKKAMRSLSSEKEQ